MDEIKRKRYPRDKVGKGRKVWAVLSAVWLVIACLAGCVPSVPPETVGAGAGVEEAGQAVRETETRLESEEPEEGGTEDGEAENGGKSGAEPGSVESESVGRESRSESVKAGAEPESAGTESRSELVRSESEPESVEPGPKSGKGNEAEAASSDAGVKESGEIGTGEPSLTVEESGTYTSKEEVALYIHLYGHLPDNYITKRQAEKLGWDGKAGNLWEVAPGMSIGGSRFGNYEKALPEKEGRTYYECDIDYDGGYRGAKRIIYSDDGLIFYTEDHYKTFEELYGQ